MHRRDSRTSVDRASERHTELPLLGHFGHDEPPVSGAPAARMANEDLRRALLAGRLDRRIPDEGSTNELGIGAGPLDQDAFAPHKPLRLALHSAGRMTPARDATIDQSASGGGVGSTLPHARGGAGRIEWPHYERLVGHRCLRLSDEPVQWHPADVEMALRRFIASRA